MSSIVTLKHINTLAIPALIAGIAEPILSITDAAIIGHMEVEPTASLAAVGIVGTFLSMLIWVLGQTRSAISSLISQAFGANKLHQVKNLPAQAIFIITTLSIVIIAITYPLATQIFKLYNASGTILNLSVTYYKIRVFGFPFTLFTIAVFGTFRGLQNTYYPMIIAILGAITNIILDYILVYGITDYIPAMHIKGAAYASVAAQVLMAIISVYFLLKKTTIPLRFTLPLNPKIKPFIFMIFNLFIRTIALNVALYFATSFATSYGPKYIAAYTIAINLWFLGAFLIDGYASAGNILSGKFYGAKQYNTLITLSNMLIKYGLIVGVIIAALGFVGYNYIGLIFTKDTEVLQVFTNIFWIVLAMQPLCALAFIFDGVFKGLGKMRYLRNVLLVSTFLVFVPVIYLTKYFNLKLTGIFIAFTFWIIARGIPLIVKFQKIIKPLKQNT